MKKLSLWLVVLFGFLFPCFLANSGKKGDLKEITKPYLGIYTLEKCRLADTDLTDYFKQTTFELKSDGTYLMRLKSKTGKELSNEGKYTFTDGKLTVFIKVNDEEKKHTFPYVKGKIYFQATYMNKLLYAVFTRP